MANIDLFKNRNGLVLNEAGGLAYERSSEEALAQYVITGTFGNTFYASASDQLNNVLTLLTKVNPEFVMKLAIYARNEGYMKDTPTLLVAWLMGQDNDLFEKAFEGVIGLEKPIRGSGKLLRNFVQMVRSGVTGKRSLTRRAMKCVNTWLNHASDELIFQTYIGNNPTLRDVLRISHPKPKDPIRANLFAWIVNEGEKGFDYDTLPKVFQNYLKFKMNSDFDYQGIPFRMLTSKTLNKEAWKQIGLNMSWHELRQNLNTLARHEVFDDVDTSSALINKLKEKLTNDRIMAFPYQSLTTFEMTKNNKHIPAGIKYALGEILEDSLKEVPELKKRTLVAVDVSASMDSPITGYQSYGRPSSVIKCDHVAALMAAALYKKNPENVDVVTFDTTLETVDLNPFDSLPTIRKEIFYAYGGGTNVSLVFEHLLKEARLNNQYEQVIVLSDNESWIEYKDEFTIGSREKTRSQSLIEEFRKEFDDQLKVVCIDLTPNTTTQMKTDPKTLNVGGFSDQVFTLVGEFLNQEESFSWVDVINQYSK